MVSHERKRERGRSYMREVNLPEPEVAVGTVREGERQESSHVYVTKLKLEVRCTVNECVHRYEVKEREREGKRVCMKEERISEERERRSSRSSWSKKAIGVKGRPGKSHLIRVKLNLAQLGEVH